MTDYLHSLVSREMNQLPVIRPRVPFFFEPVLNKPKEDLSPGLPGFGYPDTGKGEEVPDPLSSPALIQDKNISPHINENFPGLKKQTDHQVIGSGNDLWPERSSRPLISGRLVEDEPSPEDPVHPEPPPGTLSRIMPLSKVSGKRQVPDNLPGKPIDIFEGRTSEFDQNETIKPEHIIRIADKNELLQGISPKEDRSVEPYKRIDPEKMPGEGIPAVPIRRVRGQSMPFTPSTPEKTERPIIKVTIGRIEVRAVVSPQPPHPAAAVKKSPVPTLEEYLKKRNEGL